MIENCENSEDLTIYKPLKARFYILFSFSIFSLMSGFMWNAYQPIMRSVAEIYQWNIAEINLFPFLNSLIFCLFVFPFSYYWNKVGIQFVYYISAVLYVVGTFVCLCPSTAAIQSILIKIGCLINSFGGLMSLIGATVISSIWFPNTERSRATSLALSFNSLGGALTPLIGPIFVPDVQLNGSKISLDNKSKIEKGMQKFLYLQSSLAIFSLLLIIIYFPKKPKYLPSKSSERKLRLNYWTGCKSLLKNTQFGLIFVLNFITYGINSGVGAVFTSIILPLGMTQKQTGLLNMICTVLVFVAGVCGGWLGDYISSKKIVLLTTFPSVLIYVIFGLQTSKVLPYDIKSIYIVNIVLSFVSNIVCPISFEMGCEAAFPVSEELSTSILGFATNIGIVIFLAITMIPNIGVWWIPYSYAGFLLLLYPIIYFYKDRSKRKEYDNTYSSVGHGNKSFDSLSRHPLIIQN